MADLLLRKRKAFGLNNLKQLGCGFSLFSARLNVGKTAAAKQFK